MTQQQQEEQQEKAPAKKPAELATDKPVIGAASVAWLLSIGERSVRRLAHDKESPVGKARVEGVGDVLRFRRADIMRIVEGKSADVLPMRRGA